MKLDRRILCWLTGVSLGIGLLVLLNQLQVPFYVYYPRTTHSALISDTFDLYLFMISTICVPGSFAVYSRKLTRSGLIGVLAIWAAGLTLTFLRQSSGVALLYLTTIYAAGVNISAVEPETRKLAVNDILCCLLAILVLIEFATLYYWAVSSLYPLQQVGLASEELELNMTYFLFPISMILILLLLFSWCWTPMANRLLRRRKTVFDRYPPTVSLRHNLRLFVVSLDLFALLAILVFFYPYVAGQTWIVGVDSVIRYLTPLNDLTGSSFSQAFVASYMHGLYVFLLYVVEITGGFSSSTVVKFAPLLLAFVTGCAVFLAVLRAGWSFQLAILSSISGLLWLPTTLGVYAGIQANWIAFLFWMLFLGFFFMSREWNVIVFLVQGLVSLAILLIEPSTWGVFITSLVFTAIVSGQSMWRRRCLQGLLAAVMIALPLGIAAYDLLPDLRSDVANALAVYSYSFYHPIQLLYFGNALAEVLFSWSSFLSPVLLVVSLVGAYTLTGRSGLARNYVSAWIATWCLGSIFAAPIGYNPANPVISESTLWRVLYDSPLPLLLAMGMDECLQLSKHFETHSAEEAASRKQSILVSIILAAFALGLFLSGDPLIRLLVLLGFLALLITILLRYPKYQIGRMLLVSFLILVLVNTTYRSLYPLLLDPHNLLGSLPS
jgi:hypothetical protein